jgi:hypothetical protein
MLGEIVSRVAHMCGENAANLIMPLAEHLFGCSTVRR